jgi:hypothetical protein
MYNTRDGESINLAIFMDLGNYARLVGSGLSNFIRNVAENGYLDTLSGFVLYAKGFKSGAFQRTGDTVRFLNR